MLPPGEGTTVWDGEHRRTGQRYLTDADRLPDLTRRVRPPQRPAAAPKSRKAARKLPPAPEPVTVVGRYLQAVVLHQKGPDRTAETDDKELMTLALAALVVVLPRYLPVNPDPREISNLIKLTWEKFRPKTDPITMEHMVRRALRENIPTDDISNYDGYGTAGPGADRGQRRVELQRPGDRRRDRRGGNYRDQRGHHFDPGLTATTRLATR